MSHVSYRLNSLRTYVHVQRGYNINLKKGHEGIRILLHDPLLSPCNRSAVLDRLFWLWPLAKQRLPYPSSVNHEHDRR